MEQISTLRNTLIGALGSAGAQDGEQELFEELSYCQPQLLKVFDFGPRSVNEQKEVDSGRVEVGGKALAVNADFARQVKFIAQHVDCSERLCAGFLHEVRSRNPTASEIEAVELAVLEYHRARRELADCIQYIFDAAYTSQGGQATEIQLRVHDFARRQLLIQEGQQGLSSKVFTEIEKLDGSIANARTAVTNAISNTNLPNNQGSTGNLGYGVLAARLESLMYERRTLTIAFYYIARAGYLTHHEVTKALDWLSRNPKHDLVLYILSAVLASLDLSHSPRHSLSEELRLSIAKDSAAIVALKNKLIPSAAWRDASLKAAVLLKWTMFLTEARLRDPALERREGFRNEDLEMQVLNAVQGDSFSFLLQVLSQLGSSRDGAKQLFAEHSTTTDNEPRPSVVSDFQNCLLHEVELLLRSLLTHAPAELRKIKHKQEDQFRPRSDRHGRASLRPSDATNDKVAPPRSDIATLFQLVGQLYILLPEDTAVQFWGAVPNKESPAHYEIVESERGKLPSFLRWAIEVREPELVMSVFDMLAGLSTGVVCSEFAYNFMATGSMDIIHGGGSGVASRYEIAATFTWATIFGELESWAALGSNHRSGHGAPPQLPIAPNDILLGLSFLKVLTAVATYSVQARIAITSHPQYRAISCIVSLIPLGVSLELKGALFEALSAFCQPGAGMQGVEICKNVWGQMERLEVINVRGVGMASKGLEVELEEVESVFRVYPATIPFLELLSTLIHTPKRVPLKNRVTEPEPINTIPESLGLPYRSPGIAPFVSFVVDNVLASLPRREFLDSADSWKMAGLGLCFLERCLASYDLESLPGLAEECKFKGPEVLAPLVHHPGFDVLTRILSETPLRASIISYVVEGSEELRRVQGDLRFANVITRSLRIMDRVLAIQDIFLDQLAPTVSAIDSSLAGRISQSFLSRIDQGLSLDPRSIPLIGSYVNHVSHPELVFLAIKILTSLSQSTSYQNIANLIERSAESSVILDGFVKLMASDSEEDVTASEEWVDLWTGAGAPDFDGEQVLFGQATRLAIVDLLLHGTQRSGSSSLAFLLLLGRSGSDAKIQDPHALGSREYCLHIILQLLNSGVPRLNDKGKDRERRHFIRAQPLFETQPVLAERLYKLVYQLCDHPITSSSIMLYLRTREDFFARHLAVMSVHAPIDPRSPFVELVYGDGARIATTCGTLKSFLRLRAWVLKLVALELHVLTNKGQHNRVKELLELLLGTTDSYHELEGDWEQDAFRPFNDVGQSRIRIIELFQSLEFEWFDSVSVSPTDLQFYKNLNLQSCIRADDDGCEVVDRTSLFELLSNARRTLLRQGQVASVAHSMQLDSETKYILESCVVENNRREVQFALNNSYESWKRLVEVVLSKCFNHVPQDQRESILLDLLHVLPPSLALPSLLESSAILLSEVLLLLVTKLREERHRLALLSSGNLSETAALPTERMTLLLRQMVECVLDKHRRELVRGNVYASLVNYLHLVAGDAEPNALQNSGLTRSYSADSSLSQSLSASLSLSVTTNHRTSRGSAISLESSSFQVIKDSVDRLVSTISKDAIDGAEVWKTVAFTLLESLARFSRLDAKQQVLASLDRYGLLSNFVHGIKEADSELQAMLKPDPDDLNPLFVYEAKMSFLIRLGESRKGAERLLDCRILSILAQVDFLDTKPEADESFIDRDSFLPSAISRYHQLFVPAMQLVGVLLAAVGPKHATVQKQALDFVYNHRDTFIIMLKQETGLATIKGIEELNLIVSLGVLIVPCISKVDMFATNTGFGGVHNAILGLAARVLGSSNWVRLIRPSDETEQVDSETRAYGVGVADSKFDVRVRELSQKLRTTVLNYLSASSSTGDESELTVVLSPILASRRDDRSSGIAAPLPSLKDAADALEGVCDDLSVVMQEISDIGSELEHRDHVRVDNLTQLIGPVDAESLRRMDAGQRRALACQVLEKAQAAKRSAVGSLVYSLEMLLLLVWRHINYYTTERPPLSGEQSGLNGSMSMSARPLQASLRSSTMRLLVVPDTNAFQNEAGAALGRMLEKLGGVQLDESTLGKQWRSTQSFIETVTRRLKETVAIGLDDSSDR